MANPTASLARHFPWSKVAAALKVEADHVDPDGKINCPLCKKPSLHVYEDLALKADWLHCRSCDFAGDPIELACALWQVDFPTTVQRLQAELEPDAETTDRQIASYCRDHIEYRSRVKCYWEWCRYELVVPSCGCLEQWQRSTLWFRYADSSFQNRGSRMVGSTDARTFEELLHPRSVAPTLRLNRGDQRTTRRGGGAGSRRVFKGIQAKEVAIVPFEDLPGRICGFLLLPWLKDGSVGEPIYRRVQLGQASKSVKEPGLAMLANAFYANPLYDERLGSSVFVVPDTVLALQMQLYWLGASSQPLPIVASYEDDKYQPRDVWKALPDRELIFWSPGGDSSAIVQARFANSKVAFLPATADDILRDPFKSVYCWLHSAKRAAIPWERALGMFLKRRPFDYVEQLLAKLDIPWHQLQAIIAQYGHGLSSSLAPLRGKPSYLPTAAIGKSKIVELDNAWFLQPSNVEVCSHPIRIEEIIQSDYEGCYYSGHVQVGDEQVSFTAPRSRIDERGLLAFAQQVVAESGKGQLTFDPRWSKLGLEIAKQIQAPTVVGRRDVVGWRNVTLQLPTFALCMGGRIVPEEAADLAGPDAPAQNLPLPRPFTKTEIQALSTRGRTSRLFWAVAGCIVHNIIHPALESRIQGIGLVGEGAQAIGRQAARFLGCNEFVVPARRGIELGASLRRACTRHRWPVFLLPEPGRLSCLTEDFVLQAGPLNCLMPFSAKSAELALDSGWAIIRSEPFFEPLDFMGFAIPQALSNYLLDFCARRTAIPIVGGSLLTRVYEDLAQWFVRSGGDRTMIDRAKHLLPERLLAPASKRPSLEFIVDNGIDSTSILPA